MANFQQLSTYLRSLAALHYRIACALRNMLVDFNEGMMRVLTDLSKQTTLKTGIYGGLPYPKQILKKVQRSHIKGEIFRRCVLKTVLGQFDVRVNPDGSWVHYLG